MVDRLDRQILETIANAPSLVRTVTRREIEAGVLFPSATAMDIKRNLPGDVPLNLVENRLNSLERDGYIFFNEGRWWLTRRGRKEIGREEEAEPDTIQRPVRTLLEEAFTKHQPQEPRGGMSDAMARLDEAYRDSRLSEEERREKVREILNIVRLDEETRKYLESRVESMNAEIKQLESELARKKAELERIKRLLGE
jgi:hypothetical protein